MKTLTEYTNEQINEGFFTDLFNKLLDKAFQWTEGISAFAAGCIKDSVGEVWDTIRTTKLNTGWGNNQKEFVRDYSEAVKTKDPKKISEVVTNVHVNGETIKKYANKGKPIQAAVYRADVFVDIMCDCLIEKLESPKDKISDTDIHMTMDPVLRTIDTAIKSKNEKQLPKWYAGCYVYAKRKAAEDEKYANVAGVVAKEIERIINAKFFKEISIKELNKEYDIKK